MIEVLKPEDGLSWENHTYIPAAKYITINEANRILNERGQAGYGEVSNSPRFVTPSIHVKRNAMSTHRALVFLEKIEEEPVKYCDHTLSVPLNLIALDKYEEFRKQFNNCPKCGKDLR